MSSTYIILALIISLTTSYYYDSSRLLFKGYFVYKCAIWNSRTHCCRNCRLIAMVEGKYIAEYLCSNGYLYGVITSNVKLTYMLIYAT